MFRIRPTLNDSVLGLFAPDHCDFNYKVDGISDATPTLSEMTMKAIEILSTNPNGFFLFVEGGRIDMALHENHAHIALEETAEFSRAIALATNMVSFDDTLIVATADHSHTITLSGYPVCFILIDHFQIHLTKIVPFYQLKERGSNIFGIAARGDLDNIPYLKLSFANGPSYKPEDRQMNRPDPSNDTTLNDFSFLSPSIAPLKDETHGGDDVVIFAAGPHSHLFSGVMEQHNIPHFLAYATCIGHGITHCNKMNFVNL